MKGLIIKKPWIDLILDGSKSWELRGSSTKIRGKLALIQSGSGTVVGTCELVDVIGPLTAQELRRSSNKHQVPSSRFRGRLRYEKTYAWVMSNPKRYVRPRRYRHPAGAVIWVNLR